MSETKSPTVAAAAVTATVIAPTVTPATARAVNSAVKNSDDLPELVTTLQTVAPDLAEQITTAKASVHAAPWGGAAVAGVAYGLARLGYNLPPDYDATIVAVGYMVGGYVVPWVVKLIQRGKSHA